MMNQAGTLELDKIRRIQIYHNTKGYRETQLSSILSDTGGDFCFNGPIFLGNKKPCCHLKADGEVLCNPAYTVFGMAWSTPPANGCAMRVLPCEAENYVETVHILVGGKPVEKLHYGADMAYSCARTAIGMKQGRFSWYACRDKLTPEGLRDRLVSYGWSDAVMLDGGGSTCFLDKSGNGFVGSDPKRVIPYYIVVYMTDTLRHIGEAGLSLIKSFEGCRLTAYRCQAGVLTIGYGHTGGVAVGQRCTQAQADAWLLSDIAKAEANVRKWDAKYHFSQNQFDALVSFAFNLGSIDQLTGNGARSAAVIAAKMPLYNRAGGKVSAGLVRRREAEVALFTK